MYSIYHFFANLLRSKSDLNLVTKLEDFPFDNSILSCRNKGVFPDMAIRINPDREIFTGGELVELKDSLGYSISSFNSTIPTGQKALEKFASKKSSTYRQMESAGDQPDLLPIREVFYLIRGRRLNAMKVCLVHGSFFETIRIEQLIQQAFSQVLEDRIAEGNLTLAEELKTALIEIFSDQSSFSKVRDVPLASVKLRFRIMTEAKKQGNILNPSQYPQITDNTLNFIVPGHDDLAQQQVREKLQLALSADEFNQLEIFPVQHPLNGQFLVFQTTIH